MANSGPEEPSEADDCRVTDRAVDDVSVYAGVTADFYRGEIDRMTTWRSRLDQTTNWAVVIVAAILTWAFTSGDNPHYVILIGVFGATAFLLMEAHRYREYDAWRERVRTLQKGFFADMYAPDSTPAEDWEAKLGADLRAPTFDISFVEAINHRLRRSYLALLLILLVAWLARVTVFKPSEDWRETASIFVLSGEVVVGVVAVFYAVVVAIAAWSTYTKRPQEFDG